MTIPHEETMVRPGAPGFGGSPFPLAGGSCVRVRGTVAGPSSEVHASAAPRVPGWLRARDPSPDAPRRGSNTPSAGLPATREETQMGYSLLRSPRPAEESQAGDEVEVSYGGARSRRSRQNSGRVRLEDCTYEGGLCNGLRHGNGVLTWDDGRQYDGQFNAGKFHGSALMSWPDGRVYRGQYAEDRKQGEGTFSWPDGRRYQGQWVIGKRHGMGVYTNAKGCTRTGMWQMDRPVCWEGAPDLAGDAAGGPEPGRREDAQSLARESTGSGTPRTGGSASSLASSRDSVVIV